MAPEDGPPGIDLAREAAIQRFVREAIGRGLVASAQDVSAGGLAVALAEGAIWGGLGARVRLLVNGTPATDLFGESPSRLVLTAGLPKAPGSPELARQHGLPAGEIGSGRWRAAGDRAGRPGRDRRRRGPRLAGLRRARREPWPTSVMPGTTAWNGPSARAAGSER